jgi:hypothetical protein
VNGLVGGGNTNILTRSLGIEFAAFLMQEERYARVVFLLRTASPRPGITAHNPIVNLAREHATKPPN